MSLIVTQTGQQFFLQSIVADTLYLKLFSNDRTPSKTDVMSDYTEPSVSGYFVKPLTTSNWTIAIDDLTDNYVASYPVQTWSFPGTLVAYGYMITDNTGLKLLLAERFPDAPVTYLPSIGGNVYITPQIGSR